MTNLIKITFDEPFDVVYANQSVSGVVELSLTETLKKVKGLHFIIEGKAKCKFRIVSSVAERTEKFLNLSSYLFGSEDGDFMTLEPGVHSYSFKHQLPDNIPYSVNGDYGRIRYKAYANLISSEKKLQTMKTFTVLRFDDLKSMPELKLPVGLEEVKYLSQCYCFFRESKPLTVRVRLPKTGYGLGEKIPVNLSLSNNSSLEVLFTTISLVRIERFTSQDAFKRENVIETETIVTKMSSSGVKGGKDVSVDVSLEIPEDALTTSEKYCNVYKITYEVRVLLETEGCNDSPEVAVPITIGSVGLKDDETHQTDEMKANNESTKEVAE